MKFKGEIHNFSVLDLFQYLYTHEETGVLELTSPQGVKSEVFFDKGQCIRAKYEGIKNLSEILSGMGKLNQAQIDVALTEQQKHKKAFGLILQQLGLVSKQDVQLAMTKQIEDGVHELLKWNAGLFHFEKCDATAFDDIRVPFQDLLLPEAMNTAYMLVGAISKFDVENSEQNSQDDLAQESNENIGFSISLLKLMMTDARKVEQGQSLLTMFLNILSEYTTRAVLFTLTEDVFYAVGGFGNTKDGKPLNKLVRTLIMVPAENPSLQQLLQEREFFSGHAPNEPWIARLHECIGAPKHPEVIFLPIGGVQNLTSFAYADMGDRDQRIENKDLLDLAAAQTGVLMENVYLRNQLQNLYRRSIR